MKVEHTEVNDRESAYSESKIILSISFFLSTTVCLLFSKRYNYSSYVIAYPYLNY